MAGTITAFTLGHSATLLIGALGWVRLPAAPVEVAIALSILVSAVHAIRPLFAGGEAAVAAGFGLVHGLAFATVLAEMNLRGAEFGLGLAGFNLGIEVAQLALMAVTLPWLVLWSRAPGYAVFRTGLALLAAGAAAAWVAERAWAWDNPLDVVVARLAAHAPLLLGALALAAVGCSLAGRRPAGPAKQTLSS